MKKAIKILSLAMAVMLAVLCFAGCGAKKEEEKPTIVIGYIQHCLRLRPGVWL